MSDDGAAEWAVLRRSEALWREMNAALEARPIDLDRWAAAKAEYDALNLPTASIVHDEYDEALTRAKAYLAAHHNARVVLNVVCGECVGMRRVCGRVVATPEGFLYRSEHEASDQTIVREARARGARPVGKVGRHIPPVTITVESLVLHPGVAMWPRDERPQVDARCPSHGVLDVGRDDVVAALEAKKSVLVVHSASAHR